MSSVIIIHCDKAFEDKGFISYPGFSCGMNYVTGIRMLKRVLCNVYLAYFTSDFYNEILKFLHWSRHVKLFVEVCARKS
jgi:hypothetical protein